MSTPKKCVFTEGNAEKYAYSGQDAVVVESSVCGRYVLPSDVNSAFLAGHIHATRQGLVNCARRCLEIAKEAPRVMPIWLHRDGFELERAKYENDQQLLACCLEDYLEAPVDHAEKPHLLLAAFAQKMQQYPPFSIFSITERDTIAARISSFDELRIIAKYLVQKRFINVHDDQIGNASLTIEGWEAVRLKNQGVLSNKVFIATKFNWASEEPLRIQIMDAIKAACKDCGYEANTVNENHTTYITDRIVAEIRQARFLVAELTYNNRGVYYEAGLARGLGIPVFQVVRAGHTNGPDEEGKKIHFDIQQVRYQEWKTPEELREKLRDWIEATIGRFGGSR